MLATRRPRTAKPRLAIVSAQERAAHSDLVRTLLRRIAGPFASHIRSPNLGRKDVQRNANTSVVVGGREQSPPVQCGTVRICQRRLPSTESPLMTSKIQAPIAP